MIVCTGKARPLFILQQGQSCLSSVEVTQISMNIVIYLAPPFDFLSRNRSIMAARGRKGTFAFDLSHPVKKGVLLKQGAFHKAFKYRFFLVYPGFLVYYDQESKWLLDLTKGETLGVSRCMLETFATTLVCSWALSSQLAA